MRTRAEIINKEISRMNDYLSSDEGRRKLKECLEVVEDASRQMWENLRISRHLLYEPVTI